MHYLAPRRAAWPRPPRRRLPAFLLTLIAAAAFTTAAPLAGASAQAAAAGAAVPSHFAWTATPANISGNSTFISNFATNNQPGAVLFITPDWNQGGVCPCVYDTSPVGVWYDKGNGRWAIFNENHSAMRVGVSFNVLVVPSASSSVFVQTAAANNVGGPFTFINSPASNGQPGAVLMVTPVWNPGGSGGVYNDHPIGVGYQGTSGRWGIFNEDNAGMTLGASFNVMAGPAGSGGATSAVQAATSANTHGDSTYISNPATAGSPNTVVFETPNVNPNDRPGTVDAHPAGIWWSRGTAAVFNENAAPMPVGAAFNLIIYQSSHFTWTATPANSSGDSTYINNAATNNQPAAVLFITPNFDPGGQGGVFDPAPAGVWYNASNGRWAIFNENGSAIPAGASFNVLVVPVDCTNTLSFVCTLTANATNTSGASIETPSGDTETFLMVTQVWNPGGGSSGTYNNHAVGVVYQPPYPGCLAFCNAGWDIYNEDLSAMPAGASFNVMAIYPSDPSPDPGGEDVYQTATSANTGSDFTWISNAETTGNPNAVVFDTPNAGQANGSCLCVNDPSPTGIWWSNAAAQAAVLNEDQSPMPLNAQFNLIIYPS